MPTTLTSRPAHSACRAWSSGISLRQGAHQVAQKLIIKDLSPKEAIAVGLPALFSKENCGSRSGIFRGGNTPIGSVPEGAASAFTKSLGLAGLASPAGTLTPRWACRAVREE